MKVRIRHNDGGRRLAGYKGLAPGDCVARSIAIVTQLPYREVYRGLTTECRKERRSPKRRSSAYSGVYATTVGRYLRSLHPRIVMERIRPDKPITLDELPKTGRYLVRMPYHSTAFIDGVIHDTNGDVDLYLNRGIREYWKLIKPT